MIARAGRVGQASRVIGAHVVLLAVGGTLVFPVVWAAVTSFKPSSTIYDFDLVPDQVTLANYRDALDAFPLVRLLANTTAFAAGTALGQTTLAVLGAYGVTRHRYRGRQVLFALLVGSVVVPQQALVLPNYLMVSELGMLDSYLGLILPQLGSTAIAVFLLRQQMAAFPHELVEAAELDGASDWTILTRIMLPNLRAVIAALLTILFVQTWNDYLWPLLLTDGVDHATIQVGLTIFQTEQGTAWGPMMAAACLAAAPLLLVFVVAQRRIVDSFLHAGIR